MTDILSTGFIIGSKYTLRSRPAAGFSIGSSNLTEAASSGVRFAYWESFANRLRRETAVGPADPGSVPFIIILQMGGDGGKAARYLLYQILRMLPYPPECSRMLRNTLDKTVKICYNTDNGYRGSAALICVRIFLSCCRRKERMCLLCCQQLLPRFSRSCPPIRSR